MTYPSPVGLSETGGSPVATLVAGVEGIEPSSDDPESPVLPLNHTPTNVMALTGPHMQIFITFTIYYDVQSEKFSWWVHRESNSALPVKSRMLRLGAMDPWWGRGESNPQSSD